MRILIVDDSVVFRSQIRAALEGIPSLEVVGAANNGRIALQKLAQGSVDLVTLDMEMPEMGGLETIKEIRKAKFPVRIIAFSSHTTAGSENALDALAAGADDFTAKPSGPDLNVGNAAERIRKELLPKVLQFLTKSEVPVKQSALGSAGANLLNASKLPSSRYPRRELATFLPAAIVIGSSTGGPPALEKVLTGFHLPLRIPIFITQHMPPVFTASLAKRLHQFCGIMAAEAKDQEVVVPNKIYIAPGDFHMRLEKRGENVLTVLDQGPQRNSVRPCVDTLFESAARIYGPRCMGVILTGMGEDGMIGCRAIKEASGGVLIQNKETCVVFGMPGAVFTDGCFDEIDTLEMISKKLNRMV